MHKQELPSLLPLPKNSFDTSIITYRIVNAEACIEYQSYFYVVPKQFLFETCPIRITNDELMVYSPDCELLVIHKLADENSNERYIGRSQTKKNVLPALEIQQVIERLNALHPVMKTFVEQMKKQQHKNHHYQLRNILALKMNYEIDDIVIAVKRALKYKVLDARAIENFLKVNAEKKSEVKLLPNKKD